MEKKSRSTRIKLHTWKVLVGTRELYVKRSPGWKALELRSDILCKWDVLYQDWFQALCCDICRLKPSAAISQ